MSDGSDKMRYHTIRYDTIQYVRCRDDSCVQCSVFRRSEPNPKPVRSELSDKMNDSCNRTAPVHVEILEFIVVVIVVVVLPTSLLPLFTPSTNRIGILQMNMIMSAMINICIYGNEFNKFRTAAFIGRGVVERNAKSLENTSGEFEVCRREADTSRV